jgi:hypothetical protein
MLSNYDFFSFKSTRSRCHKDDLKVTTLTKVKGTTCDGEDQAKAQRYNEV